MTPINANGISERRRAALEEIEREAEQLLQGAIDVARTQTAYGFREQVEELRKQLGAAKTQRGRNNARLALLGLAHLAAVIRSERTDHG